MAQPSQFTGKVAKSYAMMEMLMLQIIFESDFSIFLYNLFSFTSMQDHHVLDKCPVKGTTWFGGDGNEIPSVNGHGCKWLVILWYQETIFKEMCTTNQDLQF